MARPDSREIAVIGEYNPTSATHAATDAAIVHSVARLGVDVTGTWISTETIDASLFERCHAVWIAPGSPYRNMEMALWAIREARTRQVPCFGTCGGFQHMIIEYARNVLGFKEAQHAEYDPSASSLFISSLECSLAGREMALEFVPGSQVAAVYGGLTATEQYYCNFGVHRERVETLASGPLRITGSDNEGEVRVIELPGHPFFIGTLFVPQARSTPAAPHPLVTAFVRTAAGL